MINHYTVGMETVPKDPAPHKTPLAKTSLVREVDPSVTNSIAIFLAGLFGGGAGYINMKDNAFDNFSDLGGMADVKFSGQEAMKQICHRLEHSNATEVQKDAYKNLVKLVHEKHKEAKTVIGRFGVGGLRDMGLEGLRSQWGLLRGYQKMEAIAIALATASITLGSIITIGERFLEKPIEDKNNGHSR